MYYKIISVLWGVFLFFFKVYFILVNEILYVIWFFLSFKKLFIEVFDIVGRLVQKVIVEVELVYWELYIVFLINGNYVLKIYFGDYFFIYCFLINC